MGGCHRRVSHGRVSNRRVSLRRVPYERASHRRASHLRVFLARRTRVARFLISTPRMVEKLLIVGDSAVRLLVTLGARSAW
jgi:hypothetical protein